MCQWRVCTTSETKHNVSKRYLTLTLVLLLHGLGRIVYVAGRYDDAALNVPQVMFVTTLVTTRGCGYEST